MYTLLALATTSLISVCDGFHLLTVTYIVFLFLGEIHAFYQMEFVDNVLRWVYKDFNFYPNRMSYGFKVAPYDIADIHSRFIKFICLRDNIMKQFPYVTIQHKVFIGKKFEQNLRIMMGRLNQVKLSPPIAAITNGDNVSEHGDPVSTSSMPPPTEASARPVAFVRKPMEFRKDREFRGSHHDRNGNGGDSYPRFKPNYHRDGPPPPPSRPLSPMMNRRVMSYAPRPNRGGRGNFNHHA